MSKHLCKRTMAMAMAVLMAVSMFCCSAGASTLSPKANVIDPIADDSTVFTTDVLNIEDAIAAADGTVTVVAQLVYRFGNYDTPNSAILEDVIDGEVMGLQVYNALATFAIGDIIKVTGTKGAYGGVPQLSNVTAELVTAASEVECIAAQEVETFSDITDNFDSFLSEVVVVKDVTLGAYSATGSTTVTDSAKATFPIYRAATYPTGVKEGETVNLYACVSKYNATQQLRVGSSSDYKVTNDTSKPVITLPEFASAEIGMDYTVSCSIVDNVGIKSVSFMYAIDDGEATEANMEYNATTNKFSVVIPGTSIVEGSEEIEILITADDEAGNVAEETATIKVADLPRVTTVSPKANSATGDEKKPVISAEFENAGQNPTVEMLLNDNEVAATVSGDKVTYTPASALADGKYTVKVTITRADGKKAEYSWSFNVGESQFKTYFGQIHSHTAEFSDGTGTLKDAYDHVLGLSKSENVDFLAVTDHSNYFDSADNLGTIDNAESGNGKWADAKNQTVAYNEKSDDVVFMYGYEMTWSGGPGHMNTYNTTGFVSRNNKELNNKAGDAGMQAYYNLIETQPQTVSQFNHPGTTFGTFADFAYWTVAADAAINLIEVGNGEGAIGGSSYWPSYEYYTLALDKGWHIAPTNNQDNHKGLWGNANTARTVAITDDFTEQGLYAAFADRRVYATEDKNLEMSYFLNDNIMGSVISEKPEKVHISASISDPDDEKIGTVSVIVNGGVVAYSETFNTNTATLDIELPNDYSYYFIRVDQDDNDIAVSAPVWTSDVLKVGISSVTSDAIIPVLNEELTLTTKVFNYEETELELDSIEYSVDGTLVETVETGLTPVAAATEAIIDSKFTPSKLGQQTITVTVYAKQEGVPFVFKYNLDLDVLDPAELIDIAIDAGHKNFYISGNYAKSDTALIELFAKNGIRSHYIEDAITYDAIKDMKLLILTAPFISYSTSVAEYLYTEDELAAIKKFADNGGNIILCSKSDRGDPTGEGEQASVISNGILEAVGAGSRIASGIVVDNERKENEAYRLYFTEEGNYNYESEFLKDVLQTTNNSFSCYNGAPVIPGKDAEKLIMGYSTTWGASYSANFTGADYLPVYDSDVVSAKQGDVTVMASEKLAGGGWLLVSGVTFFSTFEVKVEVDNSTTLQNSNYQIVMNIIDMLLPEPTITSIKDVNKAQNGLKFTIEGIVTSNASGYDKGTAFFDCIYVQDETAGINLFPVDGNFKIGQKVRVTGVTDSYNGERELKVSKIELISDEITPIDPELVSAKEAMSDENIGKLMMVCGQITEMLNATDGTLETIMIKDNNGDEARIFIDGYIMSDYKGLDDLKVGDTITAVGLGSVTVDTASATAEYLHRLRVRNRSEITLGTPADVVKAGDVDGDGAVKMMDVVMMQQSIADLITLTDAQKRAADVDKDSNVKLTDVVLVQKFIAELIKDFN